MRLLTNCCGDGRRPHHRAEEDCRVEVTATGRDGDHSVFALYGGGGCDVPDPPGGLGVDRCPRPDELKPIPKPSW
jgi:hypothetical protein